MSSSARIPLEVLFGNPEQVDPKLSPDGTRLSFLAPVDGVLNVWVGDAGGDNFAPVTDDRLRGIRQYAWAHDDRHLLYLQDAGGDENWHVYSVDLVTGEVVNRTPFPGAQAQIIRTSHRHPDNVLLGLNKDDPRLHDVYRLTLSTGELTKLVTNPGYDGWLIDHDLNVRGAVEPRPDGGVDYVVREGETFRQTCSTAPEDFIINITHPLGFTPDNRDIWVVSVRDSDTARLVRMDLETGAETVVAEHPERDVALATVRFHPTTFDAQLVGFSTDRHKYLALDAAAGADLDALATKLDGDLYVVSTDRADTVWLIAEVSDNHSTRYHRYERATGALTTLFVAQPALDEYELASSEPFSFRARDGLTVHGYVTFPPGVERANLPAVLVVHGGPWGGRDQWLLHPECQWLANRGYATLQVNYRGSGGYGKAFLNASAREWAGAMHDDLIDGLEYAIAQGWVDRDRVGIYGGSYGGYAALVGATFTPDVFRCAVDYVGPSNLITLLKSIPPYWFGVATQFHKLLGHPDTDNDFLWERSPLSRVDAIKIPLFIAQGANDPRVKQAESEQIVEALVKRGVPHEYLLFDDEGHGFARPENKIVYYGRVEEFLARYLPAKR